MGGRRACGSEAFLERVAGLKDEENAGVLKAGTERGRKEPPSHLAACPGLDMPL